MSSNLTQMTKYLGEVLESENLVDGESGEYGLFITTVDEETADDSKQQWWCINKRRRTGQHFRRSDTSFLTEMHLSLH